MILRNEDDASGGAGVHGVGLRLERPVQLNHGVFEGLFVVAALELALLLEHLLKVLLRILCHFRSAMAIEYAEQHSVTVFDRHIN